MRSLVGIGPRTGVARRLEYSLPNQSNGAKRAVPKLPDLGCRQ